MISEKEYPISACPNPARRLVAIVKSDTFPAPQADDRVHLTTTYRDGNTRSQEISYAEYQQLITDFQGVLVLLPDNDSGPYFTETDRQNL